VQVYDKCPICWYPNQVAWLIVPPAGIKVGEVGKKSAGRHPIGRPFRAKSIDFLTGDITETTAEPATEEEIAHTIKVMGGEDWELWMKRLLQEGVLAEGALAIGLSYVDFLFSNRPLELDPESRIHLDDWEMRPDIQREVAERWEKVNSGNLAQFADLKGFREEFLRHQGSACRG
jgi:trans-2-enoyl-CoA reductase